MGCGAKVSPQLLERYTTVQRPLDSKIYCHYLGHNQIPPILSNSSSKSKYSETNIPTHLYNIFILPTLSDSCLTLYSHTQQTTFPSHSDYDLHDIHQKHCNKQSDL